MRIEQQADGTWEITGVPGDDGPQSLGPYGTRREAEEDRRGLARTFRCWDCQRWLACEKTAAASRRCRRASH